MSQSSHNAHDPRSFRSSLDDHSQLEETDDLRGDGLDGDEHESGRQEFAADEFGASVFKKLKRTVGKVGSLPSRITKPVAKVVRKVPIVGRTASSGLTAAAHLANPLSVLKPKALVRSQVAAVKAPLVTAAKARRAAIKRITAPAKKAVVRSFTPPRPAPAPRPAAVLRPPTPAAAPSMGMPRPPTAPPEAAAPPLEPEELLEDNFEEPTDLQATEPEGTAEAEDTIEEPTDEGAEEPTEELFEP